MIMEKDIDVLFKRKISMKYAYKLPENPKFIPAVFDAMFDAMFNNDRRKKYVCYLIKSFSNLSFEYLMKNLTFVKNELDKEYANSSKKTVDLICKVDNEYINFEVNNYNSVDALKRNLDYAFNIYEGDKKVGEPYNFRKTCQININNFAFEGVEESMELYMLKNEKGKILTEDIKIFNIYIPNIRKKLYNKNNLSDLEKFLLIINEQDSNILKELSKGDDLMEEYIKEAEEVSKEEHIIGLYDKELHDQKIRYAMLRDAKKEAEETGFNKGFNNGFNDGFNDGFKEGQESGFKEGILETAKRMLNDNLSIDLIMNYTGLTKEEISSLK